MKSLILSCSGFLLVGCASLCHPKVVYVDRVVEVNIPVPCKVEMPASPVAGSTVSESLVNIKEWALLVVEAVNSCK